MTKNNRIATQSRLSVGKPPAKSIEPKKTSLSGKVIEHRTAFAALLISIISLGFSIDTAVVQHRDSDDSRKLVLQFSPAKREVGSDGLENIIFDATNKEISLQKIVITFSSNISREPATIPSPFKTSLADALIGLTLSFPKASQVNGQKNPTLILADQNQSDIGKYKIPSQW